MLSKLRYTIYLNCCEANEYVQITLNVYYLNFSKAFATYVGIKGCCKQHCTYAKCPVLHVRQLYIVLQIAYTACLPTYVYLCGLQKVQ